MNDTHTMDSTQPQKWKMKILPFATTQMEIDLEGIMLSEINQTKKDKYFLLPLMWNLKNRQMNITKQTDYRYRKQSDCHQWEREKESSKIWVGD